MLETNNSGPDTTAPEESTASVSETAVNEPEEDKTPEAKLPIAGYIHDVGFLDLRSAKTPDDLNGITAISDVGCILVPQSLAVRLMQIPMSDVGTMVSVPTDANIQCQMGQVWLTGEALAAGDPEATLLIIGQAFIKTPVTSVGYKAIQVHGQIMALRGSEGPLGAKVTEMHGQVLYLPADARLLMGDETIGREFLELLPEPRALVVMGQLTFEDDVTVELLKARIPEIVLMGTILVPPSLLPIVQVLTVERLGEIRVKA